MNTIDIIRQDNIFMIQERQQSLVEQSTAATGQNNAIPPQRTSSDPLVGIPDAVDNCVVLPDNVCITFGIT